MTNKDLKGLPVQEMIRCDGCGEYHPLSECEVVVIKMIKGKNCSIGSTDRIREAPKEPHKTEVTIEKTIAEAEPSSDRDHGDSALAIEGSEERIIIRAPAPQKDEEYGCTIDKTIWIVKAGASDAAKMCPTCNRKGTAASILLAQSGKHIPPAEM